MTRPLSSSLAASIIFTFAVGLAACDDPAIPPPRDPDPPADSTATHAAPVVASAAPSPSGADSAEPAAGVDLAAVAGTWTGKYDARKGRVAMPSGVKDAARDGDDGKLAAGEGSVEITIAPDGDVTGKSLGMLGAATIRGKIDGKMLRSSFLPNDPLALHAMTGVLVGIVKSDTITVELRVAGPDALIVRQANFDLQKKLK